MDIVEEYSKLFADVLSKYQEFKVDYDKGKGLEALLDFEKVFTDLDRLVEKGFFLELQDIFSRKAAKELLPLEITLDFYSDMRKTLSNSVEKLMSLLDKAGPNGLNKYPMSTQAYMGGISHALPVMEEVFKVYFMIKKKGKKPEDKTLDTIKQIENRYEGIVKSFYNLNYDDAQKTAGGMLGDVDSIQGILQALQQTITLGEIVDNKFDAKFLVDFSDSRNDLRENIKQLVLDLANLSDNSEGPAETREYLRTSIESHLSRIEPQIKRIKEIYIYAKKNPMIGHKL